MGQMRPTPESDRHVYHEWFLKPGRPNLILVRIKFIDKTEKKKERSKEKITQLV